MHGLEVIRTATAIMLSPINSKGPAASTWMEIEREDMPKVIQGLKSAMGQDKPLYFHAMLTDSDRGSLGVIHGRDNKELNNALRVALQREFDSTVIRCDVVDFGFWKSEHSKEIDVTVIDDEGLVSSNETILLTYTFMQ